MSEPEKIDDRVGVSLEDLWDTAVRELRPTALGAWLQLRTFYANPTRVYHNLGHVEECVTIFARLTTEAILTWPLMGGGGFGDEVLLALMLHDVIYDPRSRQNEAESACLARVLLGSSFPHVPDYILETTHTRPPIDESGALVLDIDLAGLASPWEKFKTNSFKLWHECSPWCPSPLFLSRRQKFLAGLLQRPSIYYTPALRDSWEAAARANIEQECRQMDQGFGKFLTVNE